MFWLVVFIFWVSLLFGTYVTGNGIGNWIALVALFFFIRSRRRAARQPASVVSDRQKTPTPTPTAAPTPTSPSAPTSYQRPTRRWR